MTHAHAPAVAPVGTYTLERRLDDIGWALFFLLTGTIWLFPESRLPQGTWLTATGLLLLGLNLVRLIARLRVNRFTAGLGLLALAAGLAGLAGVELPLVAIVLIVLGAGLLIRQFRRTT